MSRLHKNIDYKWVIYKITSPSNRVYIGKTSDFKKRISVYRNGKISSQKLLCASFKKYGFDAHHIEVIEEFVGDNYDSNNREIFWISALNTNFCKFPKDNGLNLTDGGEGVKGLVRSEETKQKLRDAHKRNPNRKKGNLGRKWTEELRTKISEGRKNSTKQRKKRANVSEETRLKMSLAKKGKSPPNKGKPMPKHQMELLRIVNTGRPSWNKGKKFEGSDKERKVKFGACNIGNTYNKGRKQHPDVVASRVLRQKGKPLEKNRKKIQQFSINGLFIKEYPSVRQDSLGIGIHISTIISIAKCKRTPKIFIFKYVA